jgi:hypothetical protein
LTRGAPVVQSYVSPHEMRALFTLTVFLSSFLLFLV